MSEFLQPHELLPSRLLCPWDSPGKNTGVGCHALLQGIFPTRGLSLDLQHCRQILYHLSNRETNGLYTAPVPRRELQFNSVAQSCLTLCDPMDCSTPVFPVHHQLLGLLKLLSMESVMQSNHLILCCPLLLLPSIFPSIRVFSSESVLHTRWPNYWSFSFNITPSNEYPGLISFRMDLLDLLVVQGTLESLLQHPSSKASIL